MTYYNNYFHYLVGYFFQLYQRQPHLLFRIFKPTASTWDIRMQDAQRLARRLLEYVFTKYPPLPNIRKRYRSPVGFLTRR